MSLFPKMDQRIPPDGDPSSLIALVGEAGGAYEARHGKPFVGPAGGVLDSCLQAAQIMRSKCYLTNCFKFQPHRNDISPYFKERSGFTEKGLEHIEELKEELSNVGANIFVALGKTAFYALCGRADITRRRGYLHESTLLPGRKVIPTIHPAATLHGKFVDKYLITHDLLKARTESTFPELNLDADRFLHTPGDYTECKGWLELILRKKPEWLSVDIEVTNHEVSCIGFSFDPTEAVSIPFLRNHWSEDEETCLWLLIASIMEDPEIGKVFQNGIFDTQFLLIRNRIHTRGPIFDTMIAHHIMYPDFSKSLELIASIHARTAYWKDMVRFKGGNPKQES